MHTGVRLARIFALAWLFFCLPTSADTAATEAWEQSYQQCTSGCGNDFVFTKNTAGEFAGIREACIQGCGYIPSEALPGYKRCYMQCKKDFRYIHGMREEFADFQQACVEGCRNILPSGD